MVKPSLEATWQETMVTYQIISIDTQSRRQSESIEEVGFYNPREEQTTLNLFSLVALLKWGLNQQQLLVIFRDEQKCLNKWESISN
uniref:Ribosomal protein S16 n=1 Tax=Lomariopsis japurensis TaxID=373558 RepID=A0A5B9RBU3_9MONI|nr:ribosomal protein S16 [Lomariopsis japurensis]QEG57416.1 ribosomal protein S16 [Lomariopsis japurensis]